MRPFPKVCYIGEVPVESSYHGSALLFRLFEGYPSKDLVIVEGMHRSLKTRRLTGVKYLYFFVPAISRLQRTRYAIYASEVLYRAIPILASAVAARLASQKVEAIVTVCHAMFWRVAAIVAERLNVPLHLIVHDHVPNTFCGLPSLQDRVYRDFRRTYIRAVTRFCVSETMAAAYEKEIGVPAQVLYPSRAKSHCRQPNGLMSLDMNRALTGVFAGTVAGPGYVTALIALATQLARFGGRVLIYGSLTVEQASALGLKLPNVEIGGLLPAHLLMERCRREADFLYVPMSFEESNRTNMMLSFPSKLADYTTMDLPLLIRGPQYCSAVQWARKHPGVAEVVETESENELLQALTRLSDPTIRSALIDEASRIGEIYFSHKRAETLLFKALLSK